MNTRRAAGTALDTTTSLDWTKNPLQPWQAKKGEQPVQPAPSSESWLCDTPVCSSSAHPSYAQQGTVESTAHQMSSRMAKARTP